MCATCTLKFIKRVKSHVKCPFTKTKQRTKGHKETFGGGGNVYYLESCFVITSVGTCKTHQVEHIKNVQFVLYGLYTNKVEKQLIIFKDK